MAQLAIKGHKTRGEEVIQLLEMLGGVNSFDLEGVDNDGFYYIFKDNKNNNIYHCCSINTENIIIYNLEEFEEKFRYKVGDKVTLNKYPCIITGMSWDCDDVIYYVKGADFSKGVYSTDKDLQLYKEETMEEPKELIIGFTKDDNGDWVLNTHKDYEIKEIEGKYRVIKKQPQYPKTYEECCEVLGILEDRGFGFINLSECENTLMSHFIQLKRCRDAYWKIAGEQMSLDKPWEYDTSKDEFIYAIIYQYGYIQKCEVRYKNHMLTFPTKEMRDAFYENFKELIEQCKELL